MGQKTAIGLPLPCSSFTITPAWQCFRLIYTVSLAPGQSCRFHHATLP